MLQTPGIVQWAQVPLNSYCFFQMDPEPYPTNEDRQEWVEWHLQDNCFLYKHANGDEPVEME